jgi:hypothetical protein
MNKLPGVDDGYDHFNVRHCMPMGRLIHRASMGSRRSGPQWGRIAHNPAFHLVASHHRPAPEQLAPLARRAIKAVLARPDLHHVRLVAVLVIITPPHPTFLASPLNRNTDTGLPSHNPDLILAHQAQPRRRRGRRNKRRKILAGDGDRYPAGSRRS